MKDFSEKIGTLSPLTGWEGRMQCGTVTVPLDYANPEGRQISIAVSKLVPERESLGLVLTNPGGPGLEGRTWPAQIAASKMGDLANDYTLVGVDVRGTGASTSESCSSMDSVDVPEGNVDEKLALDYSQRIANANKQCLESDPEYFAQLTTQNAAKDLDRVRDAMGAERVNYFGTSWGTELGVSYLTSYPDRVDKMLLDSVTDLRQQASSSLDDIAAIPSEPELSVQGGNGILEGEGTYLPLNQTTRISLTCNAYVGANDPNRVWSEHVERAERFDLDIQQRIRHPLSADVPGTSVCAGWSLEPKPLQIREGKYDNVQIVAHSAEKTTPEVWGERASALLGTHIKSLPDAKHGSLANSEDAGSAVAFLKYGTPMP